MSDVRDRFKNFKKDSSSAVALQAFMQNTSQYLTIKPFEVKSIYKTSLMAALEILEPTWIAMYEELQELHNEYFADNPSEALAEADKFLEGSREDAELAKYERDRHKYENASEVEVTSSKGDS